MENITTGHWIFAGIFMFLFIGFLVWSYRKDGAMHRVYYQKSSLILVALVVLLFVIFVFKRLL